jgi:hypothetical protein
MQPHNFLDKIVPPTFRGGDPDIPHLFCCLHFEERLQVILPTDEVVNLHKVKMLNTPQTS